MAAPNYAGLQTEIALPAYNGMTDVQMAAAITAKTVTGSINPLIVAGQQIYNLINPTEWNLLLPAAQQLVRDIFGLGDHIDASPGTNVRSVLANVFATSSTTLAALTALATFSITRAVQLGFPNLSDQDIMAARKYGS